MKLNKDFFLQEDVVAIARDLIGMVIHTHFEGKHTSGIIAETEAYAGISDRASHAYGDRRTRRTMTLYREGGISYVYLCYGMHHLFNFVTNHKDIPHAVLLRGIIPVEGVDSMILRTGKSYPAKGFSDGPGKVSKALGINVSHDGEPLQGKRIWVEEAGYEVSEGSLSIGPRIGVDYAGEDALLPYRFLLKPGEWTKKNLS